MASNRRRSSEQRPVGDRQLRPGGIPNRSRLDALPVAVQVEGLRSRPQLLDARSLMAVQAAAGNAAVTAALQRDTVVQRAKTKKKAPKGGIQKPTSKSIIKRKSADLTRLLTAAMQRCRGPGDEKAYDALNDMMERVEGEPTLKEVNSITEEFHAFRAANAVALTLAVAPHPAGAHIADPKGNLQLPYSQNPHMHFYTSAYSSSALATKQAWITANPGSMAGRARCPGYGIMPHDVPTSDITIEHKVDVATHWNHG